MSPIRLALLVTASMTLIHCGGGGGRGIYSGGGTRCAANYAPLPLEMEGAEKVSKTEAGEFELPSGNYTYAGADVYYEEEGDNGLMVHVEELVNEAGELSTRRKCVRNADPEMEAFSVSADGVTAITKVDRQITEFDMRRYSISWNPDNYRLNVQVSPIENSDFESPSKVYQVKGSQFEMYKVDKKPTEDVPNPAEYEFRFVRKLDGYTIRMSVRYHYEATPQEQGEGEGESADQPQP